MRLLIKIVGLFVILGCYQGVLLTGFGADNQWVLLDNGLNKSSIKAVAVDPGNPSTVYVCDPVFGLFRSTNGGDRWENISTLKDDMVHHLAINPKNPSILYVGTLGTVYKSIDGGWHWREISRGLLQTMDRGNITSLTIDTRNPSTIYTSQHGHGIFKSTNEGESWSAINEGLKDLVITEIIIDPKDSSIIYASTHDGGIFKSVNGGTSWSAINKGITNKTVLYLAIDQKETMNICACTLKGVFNSSDGGNSWTADMIKFDTPRIGCPIIDPNNPRTVYIRTLGGIYQSIDSGKNWHAINNGLTNFFISSLVIDSQNPANLYAGTSEGLYKLKTK